MSGERGQVFQWYERGYAEARALYDADDLEGAIDVATDLLDDNSLPRYHRIKLLILVAGAADDWWEAASMLDLADRHWTMARNQFPKGQNENADEALAELCHALDSVTAQHVAERETDEFPNETMEDEVEDEDDEEGDDNDNDDEMEDIEDPETTVVSTKGIKPVQKDDGATGAAAATATDIKEEDPAAVKLELEVTEKLEDVAEKASLPATTPSLWTFISASAKLPFRLLQEYVIPAKRVKEEKAAEEGKNE